MMTGLMSLVTCETNGGSMNQLELAVHSAAYDFPGGLASAAAAIKTTAGTLRNKVTPDVASNVLSLDEAMTLMLASGNVGIIHAMAAQLGGVFLKAQQDSGSLLAEMLAQQKEHGDVASLLSEILADNRVTQREVAALAREVNEEIEALQRIARAAQEAADSARPVFRTE